MASLRTSAPLCLLLAVTTWTPGGSAYGTCTTNPAHRLHAKNSPLKTRSVSEGSTTKRTPTHRLKTRTVSEGSVSQNEDPPTADDALPVSSVGMIGRIDGVVIPGPELEVAPIHDETPVVVRLAGVYRHGDAMRYDIEYYGLEPGEYDLSEFLVRSDGSATDELPSLPVKIVPELPPGQVEPHPLEAAGVPAVGGYRLLLIAGGILWAAGLAVILLLGHRHREAERREVERPVTVADRLRPLLESAIAGEMEEREKAELERILVAVWRRRLNLENDHAAQALTAIRRHPQAGQLLVCLEDWLHRPPHDRPQLDLNELLEPYRELPAEEREAPVRS